MPVKTSRVASFNMLLVGMEIGWLSPVIVKLRDMNQTSLAQPITEGDAAWIASMAPLVGLPFIFIGGYLMDSFGRKKCILLVTLPGLIMCFLCIFANEVWMLFLARGLCGVSQVISLTVVPAYTSEIASKEIRGALGTITQTMSSLGTLMMLSLGPFLSYLTLNIICAGMICLPFIAQLFLPESPYFLYVKGNTEDSLKVLTSIRKSKEIALEEMNEYSLNINDSNDKMELFKDKTALKTIGKAMFLSMGFQMVGANVISSYLQTIFESTNTSLKPEIASPVIGCVQLLASVCTYFLTDRFGRKPLLTITLSGMALGLVALGAFFHETEKLGTVTGVMSFLPLASFILIIFCFNAGMGSIMWMLIAELFDGRFRAIGISCSVFSTAIFIFISTNLFNSVVNAIGPAFTYWMFSVNCFITCLFIMFFIPETKGRTFNEIQEALGRKVKERSQSPSLKL